MVRHRIFLQSAILFGVIAFGLSVLVYEGFLQLLLDGDGSRLSIVIFVLFVAIAANWLWVSWQLSCDRCVFEGDARGVHLSKAASYLVPNQDSFPGVVEALSERLQARHMLGHFGSDVLLKMGLIGTIIGFILMLLPLGDVQDFDVNLIRHLMISMSEGMGIALYTTLVGLSTSTIVKLQYLLLDRAASELVSDFEDSMRLSNVDDHND